MKIIAEVEAGIMSDEWCFLKPTFSGLYSIYSVAPKRPAPKRPCAKTVGAKTPAPNRSRQTGGAKTSRTLNGYSARMMNLLNFYVTAILPRSPQIKTYKGYNGS